MNVPTYTVVSGWTSRDGQHFVHLRGVAAAIPTDRPLPEGASVRLVNGRAHHA